MPGLIGTVSLRMSLILLLATTDSTYSLSASSSSSTSSSSRSSSSITSFQQFTFSPNGVCIQPAFFVVASDKNETDETKSINQRAFVMKNVPGDGDCMFLATALATATSMGLGANDVLLRKLARETRQVVADILETNDKAKTLLVQGKQLVSTQQLLKSAAAEEGLPTDVYLEQLRKEGCEGGLYGGGPELTVLSNVLRRPISVYELESDYIVNDDEKLSVSKTECPIVCKGVFGLPHFDDPCKSIPQSAILQPDLQPGAYSWHLHLLIVQASPEEKHACVLLPQTPV